MYSPIQQNTRNNEAQRRRRLCFIVPCVSLYRWVHFPRSVLFIVTRMPQQMTQATNSLTAACSNRSLILCSEPPETPDTIMFTRGFSSGTSRCCNGQGNNKPNFTLWQDTAALKKTALLIVLSDVRVYLILFINLLPFWTNGTRNQVTHCYVYIIFIPFPSIWPGILHNIWWW